MIGRKPKAKVGADASTDTGSGRASRVVSVPNEAHADDGWVDEEWAYDDPGSYGDRAYGSEPHELDSGGVHSYGSDPQQDGAFDEWYEADASYYDPSGEAPKGFRARRRRRKYQKYYVDEFFPPEPRRGRGVLAFLIVCIMLAGSALLGLRWYQRQVDPPGPAGEVVEVTVKAGSSTADIAKLLKVDMVISNDRLFRVYAQVRGKGGFQAGKYRIALRDTYDNILLTFARGPLLPEVRRMTIPEGFRLDQIADRVATLPGRSAAKFLDIASSGTVTSKFQPAGSTNLEGLLFPDTYTIEEKEDETAILERMVTAFDNVATDVGIGNAQQLVKVTPYESLVVASLIEREAKIDADRNRIARVIYNRLAKGQALQIDATVVYALGGKVDRVLTKDLEIDSPYNTYRNKGLPPGPIAVPGRASLEAALRPAEGTWLYYVVTGEDGSHSFATTFAEHRRNIALAKARGLR